MKAVLGIALLLSVAIAICEAHPKGGPGAPPPRPPPPEADESVTPGDRRRFDKGDGRRGGERRGKGPPRDHTEGPEEDHTDGPFQGFDGQRAPDDHTEGPGKPGGRPGGGQPPRGGDGRGRRH